MKTTGIFTTHYYKINFEELNEPIYLIPFGDLHRYSFNSAEEQWLEFIEWAKDKKNSYFIGMGDYIDLLSATEREIFDNPKIHETTKMNLEQHYQYHIDKFYNEISFMSDRCIGLIEGNHYTNFSDGTTSTQRLCRLIGCKYLGVVSFIRISFERPENNTAAIDVFAYHGKGAARLMGGSLNTVQQMGEVAEANIYNMGHDHKEILGRTTKFKLSGQGDNLKLVAKKQMYIRSGGFQLGYVENKGTHVADKLLNPTDIGVAKIELTPKRKHNESLEIDIHASI